MLHRSASGYNADAKPSTVSRFAQQHLFEICNFWNSFKICASDALNFPPLSLLPQSRAEWEDYLTKIDTVIEQAIKLCLESSLTIIYEALHGTGTTGPSPLLLVQADIINNKVCP